MAGGPCFNLTIKYGFRSETYNNVPLSVGLVDSARSVTIVRTPLFILGAAFLTSTGGSYAGEMSRMAMSLRYREFHRAAGYLDIVRAVRVAPSTDAPYTDWCYVYSLTASGCKEATNSCCKTPPSPTVVIAALGTTRAFSFLVPRTPRAPDGTRTPQRVYRLQVFPAKAPGGHNTFVAEFTSQRF